MTLHSYVVRWDYGFAPNPFYGFCTLATCKPDIRKRARLDDWIVGTGSGQNGLDGRLVYAMRVTEVLCFDQYWRDPRFREKRPNLYGSLMQAYGDNIYHCGHDGEWRQENSHHSLADGSTNSLNLEHDTQADRVLVSDNFTYWGAEGPVIPPQFRDWGGVDLCAGRGRKCHFPDALVSALIAWLRDIWGPGYRGRPASW